MSSTSSQRRGCIEHIQILALAISALSVAVYPARASELQTRYGILAIDDANLLFFQNLPVQPRVEGNSFLTFERKYEFPDYDLVVVQNTGGIACPAEYNFIKVSSKGAAASESFGTCSDLIQISRTGRGVVARMPGFMGPFESRRARERAARQRFSFTYADGKVVKKHTR